MRLWIPEIGKHAVAHVASDIPVIRFDSSLGGFRIGAIDFAKIFRIQLLGQRCATNARKAVF